jgi:hypothetical protein
VKSRLLSTQKAAAARPRGMQGAKISLKPMTQHYCARTDLNNFVARKLVLFSLGNFMLY